MKHLAFFHYLTLQNLPSPPESPVTLMVYCHQVKSSYRKGKGEKERYSHLNAEFQRIARRDKKDFLSDQCKEIEENKRMGKTRDLFKKIRDTKGIFHARMGTNKESYAPNRSRRY